MQEVSTQVCQDKAQTLNKNHREVDNEPVALHKSASSQHIVHISVIHVLNRFNQIF